MAPRSIASIAYPEESNMEYINERMPSLAFERTFKTSSPESSPSLISTIAMASMSWFSFVSIRFLTSDREPASPTTLQPS